MRFGWSSLVLLGCVAGCATNAGEGTREDAPGEEARVASSSEAISVSRFRPAPGDFDGDGRMDLSVKMADGVWFINFAKDGLGPSSQWHGWDARLPAYGDMSALVTTADYDGDGKTDLSVKGDDGVWYIDFARDGLGGWNEQHAGYGSDSVGTPVPADYDGDRKADLSVKGNDGVWHIDFARDGFGAWNESHAAYGDGTAIPAPADYDGDHKADLSVKGKDGVWYIDYARDGFGAWNESHAGYGDDSSQLVPADYDGDGKADISLKGTDGNWYIDYARDGFGAWNEIHGAYGGTWSTAVPADYDGDGKVDLSVDDGHWYWDYANGGFGGWNGQTMGVPKPSAPDSMWIDTGFFRVVYRWGAIQYADTIEIREYKNGSLYHTESLDPTATRETDIFPNDPGGTTYCFELTASNAAGSTSTGRDCVTTQAPPAVDAGPPPTPIADLYLTGPATQPSEFPTTSDAISFTWWECNGGTLTAPKHSCVLEVEPENGGTTTKGPFSVPALAPQQCVPFSVPVGNLAQGRYVLQAFTDTANEVKEATKANNETSDVIDVSAPSLIAPLPVVRLGSSGTSVPRAAE